jgi:hypothetical protein
MNYTASKMLSSKKLYKYISLTATRVPSTSLHRIIVYVWCVFCMETSASSGQTKRLFQRKSIVTIDAIEHVFNVPNLYFALCSGEHARISLCMYESLVFRNAKCSARVTAVVHWIVWCEERNNLINILFCLWFIWLSCHLHENVKVLLTTFLYIL